MTYCLYGLLPIVVSEFTLAGPAPFFISGFLGAGALAHHTVDVL